MIIRTRAWLPVAAFLAALLTDTCKTAHASGWTVTYVAYGSFTDSTGTHPWPLHPVEYASCGFFIQVGAEDPFSMCYVRSHEDNSTTGVINTGTVTPWLHWNRNQLPGGGDDPFDCPPPTADVLLSVHAWALPYDASRHDNVTDSFDDPEIRNLNLTDVMIWADHPVTKTGILPTGNDDVALEPVTITSRSILPGHMPINCSAPIEFKASVFHMSIEGTSTDGTQGYPPQYFSGTDCTVTGSASLPEHIEETDGPKGFSAAVLWIDNQVANSVFNDKPYPPSVSLSAVFDSTHFHDNDPISIEIWAKDDKSKWYTYRKTAHAYNKALVLRTAVFGADLTTLRNSVAGSAQAMNHTVCPSFIASQDEILNLVPTYTAFYMITHGKTDSFGDSVCFPNSFDDHRVSAGEITTALSDPQNPSKPAYNFVMLDACNCAGDDDGLSRDLQHAFGIPDNAIDRAFLGWDTGLRTEPINYRWTKVFWESLVAGNTVWEAMFDACAVHGPITEPARGYPQIFGDCLTKLHGVYRTYSTESLDWKYPLQTGF